MSCWDCFKKHNCWDDKYIDPEELDRGCERFVQEKSIGEIVKKCELLFDALINQEQIYKGE